MAEVTGAGSVLAKISLLTSIIVLIVAGLFIAWYARRIASPIKELETVVNRIADGDMSLTSLHIHSNDEIERLGKSFETMSKNLRELIQQVSLAIQKVAESSGEAQTVSAAIEEQSASVEEIAAASQSLLQMALSLQKAVRQFRV